ncbi:MAG: tetratricopeptide repeat protein [Chlorobi bacterium]|nr:tetratricopeptide repeat protein [Chlorobiota bacterium]
MKTSHTKIFIPALFRCALFVLLLFTALSSSLQAQEDNASPPDSLDQDLWYQLGKRAASRPDKRSIEQAIVYFRKAINVAPEDPAPYLAMAEAYINGIWYYGIDFSLIDSAVTAAERALSLDSSLSDTYRVLSRLYHAKGDEGKNVDVLERAVARFDLDSRFFFELGNAYLREGRPVRAIRSLNRAMALDSIAEIPLRLGWAYLDLAEYARAESLFTNYIGIAPELADGHHGLGLSLICRGKADRAVAHYMELERVRSLSSQMRCQYAEAMVFADMPDEALPYLEELEMNDPWSVPASAVRSASTLLGYVYWKKGEKEKAQELFNRALEEIPKRIGYGNRQWELRYEMASIYALLGDRPHAYEWLEKAVERHWLLYPLALQDPFFADLRGFRVFRSIIGDVKQTVERMRAELTAGSLR